MASANLYTKIVKAGLTNQSGGYKNVVFWAPRDTFLSIAAPTVTPTLLGDTLKITTAHTFNVSEGFISLLCKQHSVKVTSEATGDDGAISNVWSSTFIILGDNAANLEQFNSMKNTDGIWLLKDADCIAASPYTQLGDECLSPTFKFTFDSHDTKEGLKEYTFTIQVKEKKFFYSGSITEKP